MDRLAIFTGSDMRTFGGGEKYVAELINRLHDFDTTIYSYKGKPPFRQTERNLRKIVKCKIEYYSAPEIPILKERVMVTISGIKAIRKLRDFDAVYCLDNSFVTNLLLSCASRRYGFKYILGIHDANILREEPIKASIFRSILLKLYAPIRNWGLMSAPNIRVINDRDGKRLEKLGYKGRIYSITDFVNVSDSHPHVDSKRFVVLFVGRLSVVHKGIDLLADIIDKILTLGYDIHFDIIGSGDDGEVLVKDVVSRHSKNVRWLGFVTEKELSEAYDRSGMLVFTSRFESFGLSLAEAQAHGLPAVAFKVRGPDVIIKDKKQGILVEPFDTDRFSAEVIKYFKLWDSDARAYGKLKKRISEVVIGRFGEEAILPKVKRMLKER